MWAVAALQEGIHIIESEANSNCAQTPKCKQRLGLGWQQASLMQENYTWNDA